MSGWGSSAWGSAPWGGGAATMRLLSATASRENQVRLVFSEPIYFSTVLDAADASITSKYSITPVAGTVGLDGSPARPVGVVDVELQALDSVNLNLDRPMTAYGASYVVTVQDVFSASLADIVLPNPSKMTFFGVFKNIDPPQLGTPTPVRDIANPQTFQGALASGLPNPQSAVLGVFAIDDTSDFAFDERETSFKKRMYRRIFAKPGRFLHLGLDYGADAESYGKRLGTAGTRGALAANIEKQVAQEPETSAVRANIVATTKPGLYRLQLLVRMRNGVTNRYDMPFPIQ